jgi:hypothetical protein
VLLNVKIILIVCRKIPKSLRCSGLFKRDNYLKVLSILLLITVLTTSCGSNYEEAAVNSGLFAGNKPVEDSFTLIPPTEKTYLDSEAIDIKLEHPYNVTVTGWPRLSVDIGGSSVFFNYVSGSGSKILTFRYTVKTGDLDLDGIAQGATIDLNGGTLTFNVGTTTQNTTTDVPNDSMSGVLVDAVAPTVAITPLSILPNVYMNGQVMSVIAIFSEFVEVTGTPQVELNLEGRTVYADYISGDGTDTLIFRYTITETDVDLNGADIVSFNLNGGTIKDSPGNVANLSLATPVNAVGAVVNGDTPYVADYVLPADVTYSPGEQIEFSLVFSEIVDVDGGVPSVDIDIEGVTKTANYISGTGTDTLTFGYTAITGDVDLNGIEIQNSIALNGSTILDGGLTPALLTIAPPSTPNVLIDGTLPQVATITPPTNNTYTLGQELYFTFEYNVNVDVTGIPRVQLLLNSHNPTPVYADYSSGAGTDTLIFRYVVQNTEEDLDGITISSPIDLNGGTIIGYNGITSDHIILTQVAATDTSSIFVDAKQPEIIAVTPPADQNYTTGQDVDFTVQFTEPVDVTGLPRLALDVGGSTLYAAYSSGSGTTDLIFRYTVGGGDLDENGIAFNATSIDLNSGTILDAVSLAAVLDFTAIAPDISGININYDPPVILSITPPLDQWYYKSDVLGFAVHTNVAIEIAVGTPRIELDIGGQQVFANYVSGTGTTTLYFAVTLPAGLEDHDGIGMVSPIDDNGATLKDSIGNDLDLTYTAPNTSGVLVDTLVPYIISITKPMANTYILNDNVDFVLNYNEAVNVSGTPRIVIDVGGTARYADYASGTGTSALTFTYVVPAPDEDTNGITFIGSTLDMNGGTIQDGSSNDTNINLDAFTALPSLLLVYVDAVIPTITSITPPIDTTYIVGQDLDFTINFDDNVTITNTPRIAITLGSGTVYADYQSGDGTSSLVFRYRVALNDEDTDGIVLVSPLDLPGGALIQDANGNDADVTHIPPLTPTTTGILVDGVRPTITNVTIAANSYGDTDQIDVAVTYDDNVDIVGGTPEIAFVFDTEVGDPRATYASGTGSTTLTFSYTVATGNEDTDGVDLPASISLLGATIKDTNGNDAYLTLSTTNFPAVLVDAIIPTVAILTPADASYINIASDSASFIVNGTCDVAGQTVVIKVDGSTAASPSGLLCDGASFAGTIDTTGIAEGAKAFIAELTDPGGNTGTSGINTVTRDVTVPTISSVTTTQTLNVNTGETIDMTVNFSETVTVTSGTTVSLEIGDGGGKVTYNVACNAVTATNTGCSYTTIAADYDDTGVAIKSPYVLNAGTVTDAAGNALSALTFTTPSTATLTVNAAAPAFQWEDEASNIVTYFNLTLGAADPFPAPADAIKFPNSMSETFTITNIGSQPTTKNFAVAIPAGCVLFSIGTDNCSGNIITPSNTCTVQLTYSAGNNLNATHSCTVTVDDSGYAANPGYPIIVDGTSYSP